MILAALGLAAGAYASDLPVESVSFTVDVTGPLAEIVIEQTFRNDTDRFIEATYVFPLQPEAAVDAMRIVVGERIVEGQIRDREEAREIYEEAAAEGRVAALTEEERPNVFTQSVANIGPGETIHVELHVIQPVPRVAGAWELVLPLVVAPRFVPEGVPDAARITPSVSTAPTGLAADIDVVVHAGLPVRTVESPSHSVDAAIDGDDLSVRLDGAPADQDFVLRWKTADDSPQVALLVSAEHALLTFEPPEQSTYEERVPRELIWVLDTSCSMGGEPLALAKRAMDEALGTMDPYDAFSVLGFGSDVTTLSALPQAASPGAVQSGRAFVSRLEADGGTLMMQAVKAALELPADRARHRVVVFFTDGQIGNDDQVLAAIARHPEITFVAVGIGSAPNRYLLDEMGLLGGGGAVYAGSGSSAAVDLSRMLASMDRPVLTEVKVDWSDCRVDSAYPSRVPDLHEGHPVRISGRLYDGCRSVLVSARMGSGGFSQVLYPTQVQNDRPMATTWARQKVADVHRRWLRGEIPDEKALIRETGLEYHILTDYTAFVAVEKDRIANPEGSPIPVEQPLDIPEGQIVVSAARQTVDVASVSRGEVLTKEFLQRIPTGRTYQSAVTMVAGSVGGGGSPNMGGGNYNENTYMLDGVNVTDPVTGTFSASTNLDAIQQIEVSTSSRRADTGGGGAVIDISTPSGTNNLQASAAIGVARSSGDGADSSGLTVSTRVAGPIVRDGMWLAAAWAHRTTRVAGLDVASTEVFTKLTAQPWSSRRFSATIAADPVTVDRDGGSGPSVYGGVVGTGRWQEWLTPKTSLDTYASAQHRTVQGDDRQRLSAGTDLQTRFADPLGGEHDLRVGLEGNGVAWSTGTTTKRAQVASIFAQDTYTTGRLTLSAGDRAEHLGTDASRWVHSPRLAAAWDASGKRPARIIAALTRYQDTDRLLIGALDAEGRPARTDEASTELRVELAEHLALKVTGALRDERFPFAPAPDLTSIDAALGAPWLDLRLARGSVELQKPSAGRWEATLRYTLTQPLSEAPEALLLDAGAPWVPGFLERWRAHAVWAGGGWTLPVDPWILTVGGFGSWASPIAGPADAWWLRSPRTAGLRLASEVPVRKGRVTTELAGTWAVNDAAAAVLPLEVHAMEPGAPSIGELAPLRIDVTLGYRF